MGLQETFYNWAKQYDAPEIQQDLNERIMITPEMVGALIASPIIKPDPRANWTWWDYLKNNELPPGKTNRGPHRYTHGIDTRTYAR